jgi:hypothetical protein
MKALPDERCYKSHHGISREAGLKRVLFSLLSVTERSPKMRQISLQIQPVRTYGGQRRATKA